MQPGDSRTTVRLTSVAKLTGADAGVDPRMFIDLVARAYQKVAPARRKKLWMEAAAPGAGLDSCACRRGFFRPARLENQASATCDICSRRVCAKHLAPRVGATVCVECAAKQEEEGGW